MKKLKYMDITELVQGHTVKRLWREKILQI